MLESAQPSQSTFIVRLGVARGQEGGGGRTPTLRPWRRPPTTKMNVLPHEIIHHIFYLSCKDGGKTATSLMLVSRELGEIAKIYLFRTIVVSGVPNLERLVHALDRAPAEAVVIEHLFVSEKRAIDVDYELFKSFIRSKQDKNEDPALPTLVNALFRHAAPCLRTCTVLVYSRLADAPFSTMTYVFPRLVHLVIRGSRFESPPQDQSLPRFRAPSLRSVVVFFHPLDYKRHLFWDILPSMCFDVDQVTMHNVWPYPLLKSCLAEISGRAPGSLATPFYKRIRWEIHLRVINIPDPGYRDATLRSVPQLQAYNDVENIHVLAPVSAEPTHRDWLHLWQDEVSARP
jgi:hypothetical protein